MTTFNSNYFYWLIFIIEIVYGSKSCYEIRSFQSKVSKLEYQTARLSCHIDVKRSCRKGSVRWAWIKDNIKINNGTQKRTRNQIYIEHLIYNITMSDAGNYSCLVKNKVLKYDQYISLSVSAGTPELKFIRLNTAPLHMSELEKKRIYWMPKMTTELYANSYKFQLNDVNRLQCQFFSFENLDSNIVRWYGSWGLVNNSDKTTFGELIETGSKYEIKTIPYDCEQDKFLKIKNGLCYDTNLKINPNVELYKYYTCDIGGQLNRTHQIDVENYNFKPIFRQIDLSREKLHFTGNSTICVGQQFIFNCSTETYSDAKFLLIRKKQNETILTLSIGKVEMVLKSAALLDTGIYVCKRENNLERIMYLTVIPCINYTVLNFAIPFFVMIIAFILFFGIFVISKRLRMAFQLKNSNRIYVMRRLVLKDVIQNPDYISLAINSKLEIPRNRVKVSGVKLGEGNFGTVFRGLVDSRDVAIKVPTELGQDMLYDEVRMMQQIGRHRHVLELIGICFDEGSLWAIMELASQGSLKNYLQSCNPSINKPCKEINLDQLFTYALQIGTGMDYLTSKSIVHRDLATRNILLSENGDIKIADFGLTRIVINYYHSMSEESRPFRWMAPECFVENKFTTKSDVWSYGIVLWEIFTLGVIPYFSLSFNEIRDAICHGVINDKPEMAPEWVYDLMKKCWRFDEDLRPTFADIVNQLESVNYYEYV